MSRKLFVGNLPYHTTEDQLVQAFSPAGQVVSARIITDRETGRSRGFGFVEYASDAAAEEALRTLQELELEGRKLRINAAEDRPRGPRPQPGPRSDSYGGGGGGGGGFDGGGFGGGGGYGGGGYGKPFNKPKGSRRGIRARKRSLG